MDLAYALKQFGVARLQMVLTIWFLACAVPLNKQLSREDAQCVEDDVEELLEATTFNVASLLCLICGLWIFTATKQRVCFPSCHLT